MVLLSAARPPTPHKHTSPSHTLTPREVVTGLMAAGDTVHVAELLAQHEAQQQLEPFPWTDTLAPYRE